MGFISWLWTRGAVGFISWLWTRGGDGFYFLVMD